jgi:predicted RNase H-like HicB family nuclease
MTKYRVLVQYDGDRTVYVARAPELEHCSAEGATRAEALGKLEEEIQAQLHNIGEQGGAVPAALDGEESQATGELALKLSKTLHRDLLWQARMDGVDVDQLVGELLPTALAERRARRRAPSPQQGQPREPRRDGQPNDNRRGPQGGGGRYHAIMEDRATFLEYVRGLDQGGGQGPQGQRGPRRGPPPNRGPRRPPGEGED